MIVTNNVKPATTVQFSTLASGAGFVVGGGNVAYIKRDSGTDATRLADGTTQPFAGTDLVEPAPQATVSMFPPA